MSFELSRLLRPNIITLKPYTSARDEFSGTAKVFLDANENSFGSVMPAHITQTYNRYPDPYQWAVKTRIAEMEGISPTQIFLGNGSDEAIDLLIRAFCEPHQDEIITLPPTYGMYKVSADINAVAVREVLLDEDFQPSLADIQAAIRPNTKIIFFCSPNNPSANLLDREVISQVLRSFHGLVVIDEAYIDFAPAQASWVRSLSEFPNLVVLKTFSKAWGLAALRLGMAFASPQIIEIYNRIKPPYNINEATQSLALEALATLAHKEAFVQEILAEREALGAALATLPCVVRVFPSDANFWLVRVTDAYALYDYLLEREIVVRQRANIQRCDSCLRITVGTRTENEALLEAMREFGG